MPLRVKAVSLPGENFVSKDDEKYIRRFRVSDLCLFREIVSHDRVRLIALQDGFMFVIMHDNLFA